jgi:DNA topoisomerase IB
MWNMLIVWNLWNNCAFVGHSTKQVHRYSRIVPIMSQSSPYTLNSQNLFSYSDTKKSEIQPDPTSGEAKQWTDIKFSSPSCESLFSS